MLLFGGVTVHPTSLATTPSTDGSFFRKKTTTTYRGQWSSSRRRSQQNTPTLLIGQSSNFGLLFGIFLMAFLRCEFSAVFLFDPLFCLSLQPIWLIHCFRGSLDWIHWWKKTPIFGSCSGQNWKDIFTNRIPFPFSISRALQKSLPFLKSYLPWGPNKTVMCFGREIAFSKNWLVFFGIDPDFTAY